MFPKSWYSKKIFYFKSPYNFVWGFFKTKTFFEGDRRITFLWLISSLTNYSLNKPIKPQIDQQRQQMVLNLWLIDDVQQRKTDPLEWIT